MIITLHKKFQIVLFLFILIIFVRFYYLQIIEQKKYQELAGANSIRKISLYAPRGIIYDRNNIPLVDNRQIYDLSVIPFDVSESFDYKIISDEISISKQEIKKLIIDKKKSFYRFRPLKLKRHVNFETISRLEENKLSLPGTIFEEFPARIYPSSARLTHALGYLRVVTDKVQTNNKQEYNYKLGDIYGFSGVEKVYENVLRGIDGIEYHLIDIYGIDHGLNRENPGYASIPGKSINLTIDSNLQNYVETIFVDNQGTVICMNPLTGEILAFYSAPDYDLNSFVGPVPINIWSGWNNDSNRPLLNRVIQGLYPPGSTMKLIIAALIIEKDINNKNIKINCSGSYTFGDRTFHCWKIDGHGNLDLYNAIVHSCNIYFYHLIQQVSFSSWIEYAKKFGFGEITGLDLFGEEKGIIPNREYLNDKYGSDGWAKGNLLTFVIGQGDVLVTPIQVINMINIIASKGNSFSPRIKLNKELKSNNLKFKRTTWEFLHKSMWGVVNQVNGTGRLARSKINDVYGKTGTAQNPHGDDHSWFVGFMKINDTPVISLSILVEHGGKGSELATSIAKKIFEYKEQNGVYK